MSTLLDALDVDESRAEQSALFGGARPPPRWAPWPPEPRRGLERHGFGLCVGCTEGAERVERLGVVSHASAKAGVDFRGVRSTSLSVCVPRVGVP